jgi:alpha-2-macroglobulin
MRGTRRAGLLTTALVCFAVASWLLAVDKPLQERRDTLTKAYQAGNYKDAYDGLRKLALDPLNDPLKVGQDLQTAISCLQNLGRVDEVDEFIEAVVRAHPTNWRLLEAAALS